MATGSGGARRIAISQDVSTMTEVLQSYCLTQPLPFDMGAYNTLRSSQAVSGLGLISASAFHCPVD